jgi:hypothetical protein
MRSGYIVLILGLLLALWQLQPPAPGAQKGLATNFSATRAFTDITAIARKPHPVGSAEHARVRGYIAGRMTALGLSPVLQSERSTQQFRTLTISAPVTNIVGTLKGKDPNQPAVLVMSHYDSAVDSPGAADDTAGVAATLEIARAMMTEGTPERDVIFLITDGEELGLMGAAAFFHHSPLAAHVGAVINFETRGDSGLATMFETGPGNADTVALYAANAKRPSANSLSRVIYKNMPNGTDLSIALEKGLPALNFAFIGDEAAYHTPLATPAHLNLGSVQHMGDQALGAARAFAERIPVQKADAVYSDVLGLFFVQYSFAVGWVLWAIAAALAIYAVISASRFKPYAWWRGAMASIAVIALPVGVLIAAGQTFGHRDHFLRLNHFDYLLAGAGLLAVGSILLSAGWFDRNPRRPAATWQMLLLAQLALAAAAQALVPEAAFAMVWGVLIAGVIGALRFGLWRGKSSPLVLTVSAALALIVVAQTAMATIALFTAMGADMPALMVIPMASAIPVLLLLPQTKRLPLWPHTAVFAVGVVLFAFGRFAPPTPSHPQPVLVRYVKDLDSGKAYRVAYLNALDRWTESALGKPRQETLPWTGDWKVWWGPAEAVNVPDTDVTVQRDGDKLRISVAPQPGAFSAVVSVRADEGLAASTFLDAEIPAIKPGAWHDIRYYVPGRDGFSWVVAAPKKGKVEVKVNTLYQAWPKDVAPLPPLPPERMAFGNTAATETVKRRIWTP